MSENVLREAQNSLEVIGHVKKINLEEKTSKAGKDFIVGDVQIEVKEDNKINVIKAKVFSNKFKKNGEISGLYKGYKTVQEEYNVGDKVRVSGDLRLEEYYTQNGSLTSFNSVNATFFNRVKEDDDAREKAIATVEMVVESIEHKMDAEGLPTEFMEVEAFTVGYNGRIIPMRNLIIEEKLGEQFKTMYYPGTTGRITLKINNYAEVETEEVEDAPTTGFGSTERVESNIVTNYVNNLEIIGGDLPFDDGVNEYSPADIEQAHKNRALVLQQLKADNQASAEPTGFGSAETKKEALKDALDGKNVPESERVSVSDDELPDF